jgi:septal ring factor EnvC (AmiA/AmiB activator)
LINTVSTEADQLQQQIEVRNSEIRKMSTDLQKMKDEYAKMIYYAYKNLNAYDRLLFIFSAKDFNQASNRLRYYQQYSSYRRTQAELIRNAQMELTMKKRSMEETRGEKMSLVQAKEAEKLRLIQEKEEKDKSVKELSKKEKQLMVTLRQKQLAANQLQIEIQKMISAEIRNAAARAKKEEHKDVKTAKESKSPGGEIMLTPVERELSSSFASNKGRLPWPTERGIITGQFGEHPHPVLKYVKVKNNGIDISTSRSAGVRAVFGGKVSRVMSFPNMNKVVIIRHGDYLTVYSNLETVDVTDGQSVSTKQKIGTVHTNTEDSKSEVHFELWLGKTLQDPQDWLSRSSQ